MGEMANYKAGSMKVQMSLEYLTVQENCLKNDEVVLKMTQNYLQWPPWPNLKQF